MKQRLEWYVLRSGAALCALLLLFFVFSEASHAAARYARSTSNWTAVTWSSTGCGSGSGASAPVAGDDVTICSGFTVTLNTNTPALNSIVVAGTLIFGEATTARTLTVTGNVTVTGTVNVRNANAIHSLVVGGNITNNGVLDLYRSTARACNTTFNGAGPQTIGGTSAGVTEFYGVAVANSLTINKSGAAITQTGAVTVGGNYLAQAGTITHNGTLAVTGNLNVQGGTLNMANTINIAGTTSISGTLQHSTTTGTRTFAGTVTINGGGAWNNSGNEAVTFGANLVNNGTLTAGTGVQSFTAATAQISGTGAITFGGAVNAGGNLELLSSAAMTFSSTLTTTGNLLVNKTAGNVNTSSTLTVNGGLTIQTGTLSVANTVAVSGATSVTGTFTNTTTTGTKTFTGGVTINSGGTFSNNTVSEPMTIGGDFINNGTFNSGTGAYTFNSAGEWGGSSAMAFAGAVTASANRTNNTTVSVTGTLALSANVLLTNNSTVTASGAITGGNATTSIWTNATGSTLNVGGALLATGTLNASASGNTVNYNGSGNQAAKLASGGDYFHLTFSTGGTNTLAAGTHDILGNLTVSGGATLNADTNDNIVNVSGNMVVGGTYVASNNAGRKLTVTGNFSLTGTFTGNVAPMDIAGNFTNSGTFTSSTGTYTFNGSSTQTLTGATTFTNLTVNNSGGGLNLASSLTVTTAAAGVLTLANGTVNTGGNVLVVPRSCTAGSIARTSGHVVGYLQRLIPAGASSCVFQVGSAGAYTPVTVAFSGVGGSGGGLIAQVLTGDHPNIATSGLDASLGVNRWWELTRSGVTGTALPAYTSFDATFDFVAGDIDGGADTSIFEIERWDGAWNTTTVGARTGGSTQATGITDIGQFAVAQKKPPAPGGFNAYESSTAPAAISGVIKTRIAGTSISLDIIALNPAKNAIHTGFTGTVRVEVLNSSNNAGVLDANGCRPTWAWVQTVSPDPVFLIGDNGRKTISFTVPEAYKDVRLRITWPAGAPTVTGCSTDNFAIRPDSFAGLAVQHVNRTTAGAGAALNATTFGAGEVHNAGRPFRVTATAQNSVAATTALYTDTPDAVLTACGGAACTSTFGSFTLGAAFASGILTSDAATYSEVGAFNLQLVDTTFAAVDNGDSSVVERTISSAVVAVGRFVPERFAVALNTPGFGTYCGAPAGFTYVGQRFNYATPPVITVTAERFGGGTTTLYAGDWWRLTDASLTGKTYTAASGSLNTGDAPATDPVIAATGGGTGTLTFSSNTGGTTGFFFNRTTAVPEFNADVTLAINVIDLDGSVAANPVQFSSIAFPNGPKMRFGRLGVTGASGSNLAPLALRMETQYWVEPAPGKGFFATNIADNCTTLTAASVGLANYHGLSAGDTTPSITGTPFAGGVKSVLFSAPGGSKVGSVDAVINLAATAGAVNACSTLTPAPSPTAANLAHLRGRWCGAAYDRDPVTRLKFGTYRGSAEFIFMRENF